METLIGSVICRGKKKSIFSSGRQWEAIAKRATDGADIASERRAFLCCDSGYRCDLQGSYHCVKVLNQSPSPDIIMAEYQVSGNKTCLWPILLHSDVNAKTNQW